MATMQAGNESARIEATWIPFPVGDRVSMEGSDWSLIKPGMLNDFMGDASTWEGSSGIVLSGPLSQLSDALNELSPSTMRALGGAVGGIERPEANGLNGNYGLRLAAEGPGVDAAVMGANLQSPIPQTRLAPSIRNLLISEQLPELTAVGTLIDEQPLQATWPRSWMAGAEISTVVGPIGVRSEAGWWSNKVVQSPWLEAKTSPAVSAGAGLDWAHGSTLFLAAEGRWHKWLAPPDALFLTLEQNIEVGGTIRVSVLNDKLLVQAAGLYDLGFKEWMTRPEIRWRISDPLSVGVGAVVINGKQPSPRTLRESLTWNGGPLGLVSDNDCAFATLRWSQ